MAVDSVHKPPLGALRGPHVLAVYLLGLVGVFVGERLVGGEDTTRYVLSGIGAILVVLATSIWLVAWFRSADANRRVEGLAACLAVGGFAGLAAYLVGSDLVLGPAPVVRTGEAGVGLRAVLQVAWPAILAVTVLPLIFLHWSTASMAGGKGVEAGRVMASTRAGAVTAMLLCTLFLVNAIADRKDVHTDLSYFKTTSPSESSREMVSGMDTSTEALLFFPSTNEVLEEVRPYFEELDSLSDKLTMEVVDRALDPDRAKEHRVSRDGTIVVARGERRQKIDLGPTMDRAKRKLRKLDAEFQKAILKLTHERKTVYLITGHGERGSARIEGDIRSRMSVLKEFLTANNFTVKNLGPVEGLASEVPDDAAMILWLDPTAPLFPGEAETLRTYLDAGGRMLITLDPDSQPNAAEFLEFLGLTYRADKLAHGKAYIPLDRAASDRYNIVTNSFSSHPSVNTVSRFRQSLAVLLPKAGSLEKAAGSKRKVTFVVRSLAKTWADADADTERGKDEKLQVFQLAAAVSQKVAGKAPEDRKKEKAKKEEAKKEEAKKEKNQPNGEEGEKKQEAEKNQADKKEADQKVPGRSDEMRVMVFADTDLFADDYIGFRLGAQGQPANFLLLADVLNWLIGEGQVAGVPESEEDIKIAHTRDKDQIWFYVTVFAVPVVILGFGAGTRWGRGRRRRTG